MDTVASIMQELERMGSEQTRKTLMNHGAPADLFGVKVGDMKTIVKRVKKNYELAIGLYNTGNSDAMYLAGLIGDETKMTKADLNKWAKKSTWSMISEYTVPFVAAESPFGWELALEWINSNRENVASAGWATLGSYVSITPDDQLDINALKKLLAIIKKDIHQQPNRVRYTMNVFLISVGSYVRSLTEDAKKVATYIGHVFVEMGTTSCKVPDASDYIDKTIARNPLGKKKKTARC
ncbi:MAG TPA: DNA alkylation repair protein [Chitinophagaceae bacterium]|mgnify:CR=1 FL=1|nr:DNA alkylation repair protein [Chitinophagaceae bacterium]